MSQEYTIVTKNISDLSTKKTAVEQSSSTEKISGILDEKKPTARCSGDTTSTVNSSIEKRKKSPQRVFRSKREDPTSVVEKKYKKKVTFKENELIVTINVECWKNYNKDENTVELPAEEPNTACRCTIM